MTWTAAFGARWHRHRHSVTVTVKLRGREATLERFCWCQNCSRSFSSLIASLWHGVADLDVSLEDGGFGVKYGRSGGADDGYTGVSYAVS